MPKSPTTARLKLNPIGTAIMAWLVIAIMSAWCAAQSSPPAQRLFASGNKNVVWFVVSQRDKELNEWVNRFSRVGATAADSHAVTSIRPQLGEVAACSVVGERLHLFYRDAAENRIEHHSYGRGGSRRELRLPNSAVPDALAGEVVNNLPVLWAVVRSDVADALQPTADGQSATQPVADTAPAAEPEVAETRPAPSESRMPTIVPTPRQLVRYDGVKWTAGPLLPPASAAARQCWLSLNERVMDLFWQEGDAAGRIHHWRYDGQNWLERGSIDPGQPVAEAVAAIINRQLVFAVLLDAADQSGARTAARWALLQGGRPEEDTWTSQPDFEDANKQPLQLPRISCISNFGDDLVIGRIADSGPQMARWPVAEQAPFSDFTRISVVDPQAERAPQAARDFLAMLALAAVMLLVFWRRRDSIALPLSLPPGMWLTAPSKRAVAALVDMLPAGAIVVGLWYHPLTAFLNQVQSLYPMSDPQTQMPPLPTSLVWALVWFRILYAGYCAIFEAFQGTTPGKRLLGIEVLSETLERATTTQVILRNVLKLIELEPYLQIWPFAIVVFFTRNRQRVGDLLARTVVVERHPIENPPPPLADQSDREE